jgi:hypothetical protein
MNTSEESNTNNNIEKLNEIIKKMLDNIEQRIIFLENLSKCNICNNIDKLHFCNNCNEKLCDKCCAVTHTKYGGYVYSCKECKV